VAWILDTDLLTLLERKSQPAFDRLQRRLEQQPPEEIRVTVVSLQEGVQGWLAFLNKARTEGDILRAYQELQATVNTFCRSRVLPFDQAAQDRFADLQAQRLRIGTLDLRIASIALATGSTLLSRNLRDFRRVPGLVVEDWTV
jgi:tRNA(fMet)-specific endonuclease VapC